MDAINKPINLYSQLMIERAGLSHKIIDQGKEDENFLSILHGMALIHKGKEVLYGNYMKTHGNDPENFALMEHYADIKRKWIRADNFMRKRMSGDESIDLMELLDTYSDIAVYAAMGAQLILHLAHRHVHGEQT